jgi:hypothetical protein
MAANPKFLDFSPLSKFNESTRGKSNAREFFSRLMDCFGASRMMWGSNFTATNRQSQSGAAYLSDCRRLPHINTHINRLLHIRPFVLPVPARFGLCLPRLLFGLVAEISGSDDLSQNALERVAQMARHADSLTLSPPQYFVPASRLAGYRTAIVDTFYKP